MRIHTITKLIGIPLISLVYLNPIAYADESTPHSHEDTYSTEEDYSTETDYAETYDLEDSTIDDDYDSDDDQGDSIEEEYDDVVYSDEEQDPNAITLDAITVSAEQLDDSFKTIKLLKKDLGIATDGADVLKSIAGISVTRQGGTASDPILRGLGGTRLNIQIDGVPFGGVCNHRMDPATAYITPGSFDSLILLKGPQSVKDGNNISGMVNFEREETRYEGVGARAYASYMYGSFNRQNLSVDSSVGFDYGYLNYTHNNAQGGNYYDGNGDKIEQTFYNTYNDRIAVGFTPDEDTLLEFSGLHSDGYIGNATIHMDVTKLERDTYNVHFKRENVVSWLDSVDLKYNYTHVDHDMDNFTYRDPRLFEDYLVMSQFWTQHFAKARFVSEVTPDIELITGLEYRNDSYDANAESTWNLPAFPGFPETQPPNPSGDSRPKNHILDLDNTAAYAEVEYQMSDALRWVSGFRVDSYGSRSGTMHSAGESSGIVLVPSSNQSRRQNLFAGFLRGEYAFEGVPITIAAGYGHAERGADYWEIYNTNGFFLNPEKNDQFDLQVNYQSENLNLEFSTFYSYINDFILIHLGDQSDNIEAQRTGFELNGIYRVTDSISLNSNLSYTYGKNITQNTPLAQTPPLEGNIGIQYDDSVFFASVNTRLVNNQNRIHKGYGNILALDSTPTAGFVTASLQLGYTPHPLVKLQFGIDNIFDKTYSEHLNRSGSASAAGPAVVKLNEPGRAYWGRITIDLDYPASFL